VTIESNVNVTANVSDMRDAKDDILQLKSRLFELEKL